MKKLISVILCMTFLCNIFLTPALADNVKGDDPKKEVYYEIPVEYSNQVGKTETAKVMIKDGNAYMNASTVGEKSGYGPMIGKDTISLTNTKNFHQAVFSVKDTSVKNTMGIYSSEEYQAPYPSVINDKGAWIPLQYSWLLLNGSADIGDKGLYITLPTDNVLDALFDLLKNNHNYAYNIINNNVYSEKELAGEMNLNKFSLLLKAMGEVDTKIIGPTIEKKEAKISLWGKDKSIWLYEVHLPNINENIDKKYAKMLGTTFCTMSAKELEETKNLVKEEKVVMSGLGLANMIADINGEEIDSSIDAYNKVVSALKKTDIDYNPAVRKLKELEKLDSDNKLFQAFGKEAGVGGKMLEGVDLILTAEMYLDQFKNQDQFSMDALEVFLENGKQNSIAGECIMKPMEQEMDMLSEDLAGYSVNTFIDCVVNDGPTKVLNYLATLGENAVGKEPSVVLARLAFDVAMNWIPFYKEGFTEVEKFDLCNYASVVAADAHNQFVKQEQNVLGQKGNPSIEDLYRLSQSGYSYLKFTYIARDAAIASVEAAMKAEKHEEKEDQKAQELIKQQKEINKQIAVVLAKLKTAEKTNEWGCYGFLPEDNQKYLEGKNDGGIAAYIQKNGKKEVEQADLSAIWKAFLAKNGGTEIAFRPADYDGDGKKEAFAAVRFGSYDDDFGINDDSEVYFISSKGEVSVVDSGLFGYPLDNVKTQNKQFFGFEVTAGTVHGYDKVWGVRNGGVYKLNLPDSVMGFGHMVDGYVTGFDDIPQDQAGYELDLIFYQLNSSTGEFYEVKRINNWDGEY